jgi:hypothetical protein
LRAGIFFFVSQPTDFSKWGKVIRAAKIKVQAHDVFGGRRHQPAGGAV